jgi:hypothetical protein
MVALCARERAECSNKWQKDEEGKGWMEGCSYPEPNGDGPAFSFEEAR